MGKLSEKKIRTNVLLLIVFLIHGNSRYIEWKWNQFVFSSIYVHFTANPLIPHPLIPMHTHTHIVSLALTH